MDRWLAFAALLSASCASTPDRGWDPQCGARVANAWGVAVRSNGRELGTGDSCAPTANGTTQTDYGPRYQCVELVSRFFVERHQTSMPFGVDANQLCAHARKSFARDVEVHDEADYVAEPGDAVVFAFGKFGHAGIVEADLGDSVSVFEQNASREGRAVYAKSVTSCFIHARRAAMVGEQEEE